MYAYHQTSSTNEPNKAFNVQICGNSSVGKTSIIHRLIYDNYLENTVITLGVNYYKKKFTVNGEEISVLIHDTSGQERYIDITKQSVRKADALILVYDKTNEQSFQDLETLWITQLQQIIDFDSIPLILIGNKQDLSSRSNEKVSYDQADQLARFYNMTFFETSALSGHQVETAFTSLIQRLFLIKNRKKERVAGNVGLPQKRKHNKKDSCC